MKKSINYAVIEGIEIDVIVRDAKNCRRYVWKNPTQKQTNKLIDKHGFDQICGNTLWLQW